ncbi:MAG: alpha/beta hydrolase [Candidatus Electrothrix communis]|nr:MAG: alpha/beta hydrolase [Candidatus Electrothrix communis]
MKLTSLTQTLFLFLLSVCTVQAAPALTEIERHPFYKPPVITVNELRVMMQTQQSSIMEGMKKAGHSEVFGALMQQFPHAKISTVEYQPGETFRWILYRSNGAGEVKAAMAIVWDGNTPLKSYEFFIDTGGKRYTFAVPLLTGNLALKDIFVIKTVTKVIEKIVTVPSPERIVEKIVEIQGPERIIEKIVQVPGPERIVHVPGPERIVEVPVSETEFALKKKLPNYTEMSVFFATDRKENVHSDDVKSRFTGQTGDAIKYGITKVSIPEGHKTGVLRSPSWLRFEFRENPKKHVVLLNIDVLDKSSYYQLLSQLVSKSPEKSAFVYIHGFNVSFEDAARRTAQMAFDLNFNGVPVFYSWPTDGGKPHHYLNAEENIRWSKANIKRFLKDFVWKSKAENIYLIAHSMGTRGLTEAYVDLIKERPELRYRFKEIILAAPDIDVKVFNRDIAPVFAQANSTPVTLYASSDDVALMLSSIVHMGPSRLGDSREGIHVFPGIESIDASNVATSFLEHSYYGDSESIISDIENLITTRKRAGKREQENKKLIRRSNPKGIYWKFNE